MAAQDGGGFGGGGLVVDNNRTCLQLPPDLAVSVVELNGMEQELIHLGNSLTWTATFVKAAEVKPDTVKKKDAPVIGKVIYPFEPFGWEEGQSAKAGNYS